LPAPLRPPVTSAGDPFEGITGYGRRDADLQGLYGSDGTRPATSGVTGPFGRRDARGGSSLNAVIYRDIFAPPASPLCMVEPAVQSTLGHEWATKSCLRGQRTRWGQETSPDATSVRLITAMKLCVFGLRCVRRSGERDCRGRFRTSHLTTSRFASRSTVSLPTIPPAVGCNRGFRCTVTRTASV
jgi:hypothetical protein